jgi:hypothetical protein
LWIVVYDNHRQIAAIDEPGNIFEQIAKAGRPAICRYAEGYAWPTG